MTHPMPTALELTRAGWQAYLSAARQSAPAPAPTASQRTARQALLRKVRSAAALLKDECRALRFPCPWWVVYARV
jgi:hypothetical protein